MEQAVRDAAIAYAAAHYPDADLVVVGGSAAVQRRPRSDIDLLVIGPSGMFPDAADEAAHTDLWRGDLFEVFAGTADAFRRHLAAGVARLRPVSPFLLVDGVAVLDRGSCDALVAETRAALAVGPSLSRAELDARRYAVTNTLDDLLDADEGPEQAVLAAVLVQRLAELVLLANGRWIASGRQLLRRLGALDPELADALGVALADRDTGRLERITLRALAPLGGRLQAGYRR